MMQYVTLSVIAMILSAGQIGIAQEKPIAVALKQVIENPREFDGKLVEVQGFLVVGIQPRHAPLVILYLCQEDAKRSVPKNGIIVIPNHEMMRRQEEISHNYVSLTGVVHAFRGGHGAYGGVIKEIQDFRLSERRTEI